MATYNGNVDNNDLQSVIAAPVQLRLLNSNQVMVTWAPQRLFDRVIVRLNSGLLQALNAIGINYAYRVVPQPHLSNTNVNVCKGKTTTLRADSLPGVSYSWYKQPSGGTPIYIGSSYTTGGILSDSIYYVQAVRNGCANPQRSAVTIRSLPLPDVPVVMPDSLGVCRNESGIFTAVKLAGITHRWYSQSVGGTLLSAGDTFTTQSLTLPQNYYAASVDTNGCVSADRAQASVVILPPGPGVSMGSRATLGGTGGDAFVAVINTPDRGYFAVGNSASNDGDLAGQNHGSTDFWALRLDSNNNKLWSKAIGTSGKDSVTGVVGIKEGKFIISGVYNTQSPSASGQLVCIDKSGNTLWTKQITVQNPALGLFPKDSNVIVAGTVGGALQLMIVNASGIVQKTVTYNGNYAVDRISIVPAADKGLLIAGTTVSGGTYKRDMFVDKIDSNLNRQWEKVFLGTGDDVKAGIFTAGADHFMLNCITLADTTSGTTVKILRINADGVPDYIKVLGPLTLPLSRSARAAATGSSKVAVAGKVICPPVCRISCPFGNTRDDNGCDLCMCEPPPGNNMAKSKNVADIHSDSNDLLWVLDVDAVNTSGRGANDVLYLMRFDSTGNIVALQTDSTNAIIPAAITNGRNGGALMLGASSDSLSKATIVKIDPPSCPPLVPPVLPVVAASLVHDQQLIAYKEMAGDAAYQTQTPLLEAFPNPFSETFTCRYIVQHAGRIVLRLTHADARRDVILKDEQATPGVYSVRINTSGYQAGIYILTLRQGKNKQIQKIIKL
ncbi:T9SS type A sorting domain-containing protein [Chitinophaga sp. 22536]|uniref:Ig-like domain-containing protein n=1 Tax=unclassified Chitinophaga TaxID=2619133 RepID=UPI003F84C8D2